MRTFDSFPWGLDRQDHAGTGVNEMAGNAAVAEVKGGGRSRPPTRAIVLGGLLVGELVGLAWHFESAPLKHSTNRFVAFLGEEGVVPLAVAIATATALLASARNRS